MGGDYDYGDIGKVEAVALVMVPVTDIDVAIEFYVETLGMRLEKRSGLMALVSAIGNGRLLLIEPEAGSALITGGHTGIVFTTSSVYDLHRRMVDQGVVFTRKPMVTRLGLEVEFEDQDGNRMTVIEYSI